MTAGEQQPATAGPARYALLCYETQNLGDEIQSVAARQFLPQIDLLVDRDRLNRLPEGAQGNYKIILNGWHTRHPENWPPAPSLIPLPVSIHLSSEPKPGTGVRASEALLSGESLEFLRSHAPIGARDHATLQRLRAEGIDAYFSACLTLTLGDGQPRPRGDYICAVDLPPRVLEALRARSRSRVVMTTHRDAATRPFAARMRRAERLLSLYAQARSVVTSRLHCTLPCLALGTPVLLVKPLRETDRFTGFEQMLRGCSLDEFLNGEVAFDADNPPENSERYLKWREELMRTANTFASSTAEPSAATLHPFRPDTDVENLIGIEESFARKEAELVSLQRFQRRFCSGRDYSKHQRLHFLRDLANAHEAADDLEEAKRLLEIALAERPGHPEITKYLEKLENGIRRRKVVEP